MRFARLIVLLVVVAILTVGCYPVFIDPLDPKPVDPYVFKRNAK